MSKAESKLYAMIRMEPLVREEEPKELEVQEDLSAFQQYEDCQSTPNGGNELEISFRTAKSDKKDEVPTFMGSKVFTFPKSRTKLPFFRPDEPIPWAKIIRGMIGKDLSKISLPVILNEPASMM